MPSLAKLLMHGVFNHLRAVPKHMRSSAHGEVDVFVAVDIGHMRAFGRMNGERCRHLECRHNLDRKQITTPFVEFPGLGCHRLQFLARCLALCANCHVHQPISPYVSP